MSFSVPFRWKIQRKTQSLLIVIRFLPFRLDMCLVLVKLLFFVSTHWMLYGMPGEWEWRWMQGWGNGGDWMANGTTANELRNSHKFAMILSIEAHSQSFSHFIWLLLLTAFALLLLRLPQCCGVYVSDWASRTNERNEQTSARATAFVVVVGSFIFISCEI